MADFEYSLCPKNDLYKSKAYKQNDTARIAVDILELSRLILEGKK